MNLDKNSYIDKFVFEKMFLENSNEEEILAWYNNR